MARLTLLEIIAITVIWVVKENFNEMIARSIACRGATFGLSRPVNGILLEAESGRFARALPVGGGAAAATMPLLILSCAAAAVAAAGAAQT